ncbi:MAG: ABC transporter permease [Chthoniobacteraceae bacterium]
MTRSLRLPSGLRLMNFLLGSWTGVVFAFLYIPILLLAVFSFNDSQLNLHWEGFTLDWYRALAEDTVLLEATKNSLIIAAITTVLATTLGTAGAWLLHRYRFPLRRLFNTLIFIPMVIPEIIMGISLLILFSIGIGWAEQMQGAAWAPQWLADAEFGLGYTTVIISHVTFCFPFVLVAVQARLAGVDPALEEAAMDLGATPWRAFWHVMVPFMAPAIVSGALLAFTLSMDEVIVTFFTAGSDSQTLPLKIFGRVKKGLDPSLNAISTVFILATAALVVISEWIKRPKPRNSTSP